MQFAIVPVFCDASEDGNISLEAIASAITHAQRQLLSRTLGENLAI